MKFVVNYPRQFSITIPFSLPHVMCLFLAKILMVRIHSTISDGTSILDKVCIHGDLSSHSSVIEYSV